MSEYKGIKGFTTQTVSTDPAASIYATGTWASGGDLNTAVNASGGSNAGSQTASINFAGNAAPYPTVTSATESYNGTSWSPVNNMNTARWGLSSFGPQTAAVGVSGVTDVNAVLPTIAVEQWNGTSWTEVAELSTVRHASGGFGTGTAGLIVGGQSRPGSPPGIPVTYRANVEAWNGTSWTAGTAINTARDTMFSFGINTSGLIANGQNPTLVSNAESWNGTSWTEVAESNTTRYGGGAAGSSNTLGLIFGGYGTAYNAQTEIWDGTSWTELNDLATARANVRGSGSIPSALAFAGQNPPIGSALTATEEWTITATPSTFSQLNLGQVYYNSTSNAFKVTKEVVPAGTWASGGNLNTARNSAAGAGTQTAGMFSGGRLGPPTFADQSLTELYNGSAWTEVNDLNTARYALYGANSGSQTATLVFAGYYPPGGVTGATESWDGTNWTELNDLNTAGGGGTGFGTQPAAVAVAGDSRSNLTELWDGTNWTEVSEINTTRAQMAGFGLATAGLIAGGDLYPITTPTRQSVQTELWNGTSWTEVNDLNTGRRRLGQGGFGTQTSGLIAGGYIDPALYQDKVETWDGTSWTEQTEIQTRDTTTGVGSGANSGFIAGGGTSPGAMSAATEEWNAATQNQTITVS